MSTVNIKINGYDYTMKKGITILDASFETLKMQREFMQQPIPTLYYMKGVQDVDQSGVCIVEVDGEIVNVDGTGNRIAAIAFGPDKVILVAGVNKIVNEEKDAIGRILTDACPPNCIRLGKKTPCAVTGKCGDCLSVGNTICSYTVVTRFSPEPDRLHVVMVNEVLGY